MNIILYPTETLYALGVNALDAKAVAKLQSLKGRGNEKPPSWLVRDVDDIKRYAELSETAAKIATRFLPGPLTLVLKAKIDISDAILPPDRTIAFRISGDEKAKALVEKFMGEYDAPLTCTSANISGSPTFSTVPEILQQFGAKAKQITEIIDDDSRKSLASTIVRVIGDDVTILREGEITEFDIRKALEEGVNNLH